ncbi:MAG: hypothetical protein WBV26_01500, partial [Candidatus Sulfotelmatobacter sp.]
RIRGDEKLVEEMRLSRVQGGRSVRWRAAEENVGTGDGRIVHRDCTGNAERQEGGSQLSDFIFWFLADGTSGWSEEFRHLVSPRP